MVGGVRVEVIRVKRASGFPLDALLITNHKYVHVGKICMLLEQNMNVSIQGNIF